MTRLPLTVIGGYLGAGKTTLINRLLANPRGLRLAVLVNDFGAINIDAGLLKSADQDTIELTNGCVCCTLSGDLFFAIGDILDRPSRPDHLIVEASGIADPAKIAAVALAERELRYSGILTVVDAANFPSQISDPRISGQLLDQVHCADVVAVSKIRQSGFGLHSALEEAGVGRWIDADDLAAISGMFFQPELCRDRPADPSAANAQFTHPGYVQWSQEVTTRFSASQLDALLARLPEGVIRLKAVIPRVQCGFWEVHVVGTRQEISHRTTAGTTGIVAIGLEGPLSAESLSDWWND